MDNLNITVIKETINRLILLQQAEKNYFINAPDRLTKTVASAKMDAYTDSIRILQEQMEQAYG